MTSFDAPFDFEWMYIDPTTFERHAGAAGLDFELIGRDRRRCLMMIGKKGKLPIVVKPATATGISSAAPSISYRR